MTDAFRDPFRPGVEKPTLRDRASPDAMACAALRGRRSIGILGGDSTQSGDAA